MLQMTSVEQTILPRVDYPTPQWQREDYVILNGIWEFDFDDYAVGLKEKWYRSHEFQQSIVVPFCYQSALSGIGETEFHDIVWYRRTFTIPQTFATKRIVLHFGAVDYEASVYVNGELAIVHQGGHTPFSADVTDLLMPDDNVVVVRAKDVSQQLDQPRGKQFWKENSTGIFYTRTTGIWQTVWLEAVSQVHINEAKFTPDFDKNAILVELDLMVPLQEQGKDVYQVQLDITFEGQSVIRDQWTVFESSVHRQLYLGSFEAHTNERTWSPEHPHLYDIVIQLKQGNVVIDQVISYFGMRKIEVVDGRVFLNNHPYYMKLVLDQGYYPDGILTPPSDDAIKQDIILTKKMGFNGVRKHQKIEDPRFLYWCDRLGLLVWGEMANSYVFSQDAIERITKEWQEAIRRDYNHPCIVVWVPLNESWGVPTLLTDKKQRAHAVSLYALTKSLDNTRLVVSNDGWEHTMSDLCTIHDYDSHRASLLQRYSCVENAVAATPGHRLIYAPGYHHKNEPILVTEFGGISFKCSDWDGWGYSGATSEEDFIHRYREVVHALLDSPSVQGFCYTQLTDVEQEINGLLTYDRKPKVDLSIIAQINEGKFREKEPDIS